MSGKLTKSTGLVYTPGSPAVPATPGSPYVPAHTGWEEREYCDYYWYSYGNAPPFRRYECHTSAWLVKYPEAAAVAPTAAIPARPAQTVQDFNIGWNSGAISLLALGGDCEFVLAPSPSAVGIVAGLNSLNEGTGYLEIDHGLYFSRGKAVVYESGEAKTAGRDFASGDEFAVRRLGRTVSYLHNATPLYTSLAGSEGTVFADVSMYMGGDTILSAAFSPVATSGEAHASLLALGGTASNNPVISSGATLSALEGTAFNFVRSTSTASLRPLAGASSDRALASSQASFEPLSTSSGSGGLVPPYTLAAGSLAYLLGAAHVTTGEVASSGGVLQPMQGVSSDRPYAFAAGALEPLATAKFDVYYPGRVDVSVALPAIGLNAGGHDSAGENAFAGVIPRFALRAFGGVSTGLSLPSLALDAAATVANWAHAALSLPPLALGSGASVASMANAELAVHDAFRLVGYSGAVCTITVGRFTVTASSTVGAVGQARLELPLFEMVASATAENYGGASLLLPALQMGARAQAWLTLPGFSMTAIGTAVVAVSYEAYSINLSHVPKPGVDPIDEVTHYTNFPFDRIVRYQGSFFGVAADGLYLLEGTTDDGVATPYAVKTCVDDFKVSELKTVASAYFGGRLGPDATVTLHAGEQGQESYPYSTPRGQGAQNHREKFGRGVKNRYFAIGVAGDGALGLDTIELEVNKMSRRI